MSDKFVFLANFALISEKWLWPLEYPFTYDNLLSLHFNNDHTFTKTMRDPIESKIGYAYVLVLQAVSDGAFAEI